MYNFVHWRVGNAHVNLLVHQDASSTILHECDNGMRVVLHPQVVRRAWEMMGCSPGISAGGKRPLLCEVGS